jgi:hypothetical protein
MLAATGLLVSPPLLAVPALPKFAPSGIAFIWAMNSVTDCAFSVGLTTRTLGTEAM